MLPRGENRIAVIGQFFLVTDWDTGWEDWEHRAHAGIHSRINLQQQPGTPARALARQTTETLYYVYINIRLTTILLGVTWQLSALP